MLTSDDNTIEGELRDLIARGPAGAQLPSVRELTRRHRASPVTVQRVVTRLAHEGLVDARPGHGTFVAARRPRPAADVSWQTLTLGARPLPGDGLSDLAVEPPDGVLSLATGYPDRSLWPVGLLASAAARAARRPEAWGRANAQGHPALRAWFAAEAGAGMRPEDVLVVAGGQAALSAAFRSLAAPGDPIVLESPTYVGAIEAARAAGLRPVPVPVDAEGLRVDLAEAALRATGAALVYVQPRLANPTGTTLPAERRTALLRAARAAGAFVIEDDFVRDLAEPGGPAPMLSDDVDGHVVSVRSLTKSTAPALRIAAVIARGPAMGRLRNARLVDDFFVSGMLQETALGVVTAPGWQRHVAALRRELAERMAVATVALDGVPGVRLDVRPRGGFLLWLRLDAGADATAVAAEARGAGVLVTPGSPWFPAEPDGAYLRLSVAGIARADIGEGVRRLNDALGATTGRPSSRRRARPLR